jgi:hypothetical protein
VSRIEQVRPALDRFRESHFYLHEMERYYHYADQFRWSLNSFLRSLKEVPQLLQMSLQSEQGFSVWYRPHREALRSDPLISALSDARDFVVHRGALVPKSRAYLGVTEGRGLKIGVTFGVDPFEDSDLAMKRYVESIPKLGDGLEILRPDEESLPCIERDWRLLEFDEELVELAVTAWRKVGALVSLVLAWLELEPLDLALSCRHSPQRVRIKIYDRESLFEWLISGTASG